MKASLRNASVAALLLGAVGILGVAPAHASPNLVVNGSFEADNFNAGGGYRLGLINNDVTGWFIPAGDGVYPWGLQNGNVYSAGPADTGNQWLVLGEAQAGQNYTIRQTVSGLTSGNLYSMNWAAASELYCCAMGELSFLSGSANGPVGFTSPGSGPYWTSWGHYSTTFTANANSVTFQFKDMVTGADGYDLGLDSVSMYDLGHQGGVPEPASWALMIMGFAGIGAMLRRRVLSSAA